MAWTNSHAACQTELFLFHPILQDLLYCPADVHGCAWRGGSPMPRTFQREISMCARGRLDGQGKKPESTSRKQSLHVWISVTSLSSQRPGCPSRTCLRIQGTRQSLCLASTLLQHTAPWAQRVLGQQGSRELRAAAALHASAQLCCRLCGCVWGGHGVLLNGFSLTNVPVWMQFTVFPPVLAVTVTGFFSVGFMVFVFFSVGKFSSSSSAPTI